MHRVAMSTAGWTTVRFGDVVRRAKDKVDPRESGLDRYIAGEHMDTDDLRIRRWGTISDGYLGPAFHMRFRPGQVLYGSRRTYLRKVALATFEGITANTTYVLEPIDSDRLLPELLPFIMQTESFHAHSKKESRGSVNPYVNFSDLARYEFALPPCEEQRRLSTCYKQPRPSTKGTERLSNASVLPVYQFEDQLEGRALLRLTEVTDGLDSGKSPASSGHRVEEGQYGVLKVSAVGDWEYVERENKRVSESEFVPRLEVKAGDFLVTRANADPRGVARTCIAAETRSNLMLSDKTWRLRLCDKHQHAAEAILAWSKSRAFRSHVRHHLNGTDAKNISQASFLAAPVPSLTRDVLEFGEHIRTLSQGVVTARKRVQGVQQLKQSLLTKALGK